MSDHSSLFVDDDTSAEFNFTDGRSTWAVDLLVPGDDAASFAAWARDLRMILRSQDLPVAEGDANFGDAAGQRKALTSIYFSVTVPYREAVEGCKTSAEAFAACEAKVKEFAADLAKAMADDK